MIADKQTRVVLVTCGTILEARRIANKVVRKRLAACVNIVLGPIQSVYRWKGRVTSAREVMMVVKTTAKRLPELEKEILRLHSYDVPEFIALPVSAGSREYLAWIHDGVKTVRR
jgi:periplasmic divalent cation tolerance protein